MSALSEQLAEWLSDDSDAFGSRLPLGSCSCSECAELTAAAVLASEPMQQIRQALFTFALLRVEGTATPMEDALETRGCSPAVIAWVMEDA